jgi:hypothetical protein
MSLVKIVTDHQNLKGFVTEYNANWLKKQYGEQRNPFAGDQLDAIRGLGGLIYLMQQDLIEAKIVITRPLLERAMQFFAGVKLEKFSSEKIEENLEEATWFDRHTRFVIPRYLLTRDYQGYLEELHRVAMAVMLPGDMATEMDSHSVPGDAIIQSLIGIRFLMGVKLQDTAIRKVGVVQWLLYHF